MEAPKVLLSGALELPFWVVPNGGSNSTPDWKELNLRAVFRIEAPVLESSHRRASIDLVVVLDVTSSISFADNQLSKLDLLKKAEGFITSNLDGGDRLAMVAFRNNELIEISSERAEQRVTNLETVGFATAKSGLEQAVKILDDRSNEEERQKRQGFIILVSDRSEKSYDDRDKWSAGDPALRKYPIHTLGLGKFHDPTKLALVADESNGTYSSVNEASKIMESLAVCLALFKSVVAVDASVQIEHEQDETTGSRKRQETMTAEILHCDWGGFKREQQGPAGAESSISCNRVQGGVLYAGEVKHLIVGIKYKVLPTWTGSKRYKLVTATATYKHAAQQGEQSNSTPIKVQQKLSVSVCISPTMSSIFDRNSTYPSPKFLDQMVRLNVLEKCIAIFLQKCQDKCKAENANNHALQVQGLGDDLESRWKDFKETDVSWKEAQKIGLDLQLQRIESDIDAMVSGLKQQDIGLGCVYSWQSSHKMQRAATTGCLALTTNAAFLTPAIKDMVKKAHHEQSSADGNPSHDPEPPMAAAEEATPATPAAASTPADHNPPPHPASGAVQLMDGISKRFEEWCKLDRGVPPVFQPSSVHENNIFTDLTTVLRKDISQAMQYDLYLTVRHAVNQWRESSQQQAQGFRSDETPAPAP